MGAASAAAPTAGLAAAAAQTIADQIEALQAQIAGLYDHMPFGSHTVATDGTYASVNALTLAWTGCTRESLIGKRRPADFLSPPSRQTLHTAVERQGMTGFTDLELELVHADGAVRPIALSSTRLVDAQGLALPHRMVAFDLTAVHARREAQRIAAMAFDALTGICITDADGHILQVNRAFTTLTGYEASDVQGRTMHVLASGRHAKAFYDSLWLALKEHGSWQGEIYDRRKDGSVFVCWLSISAVPGGADQGPYYVGSLHDITDSKASQEAVSQLAYYDTLTQLPNRRYLQDKLARVLAVLPRSRLRGALLFIDLDNFKQINDTRGHPAGDTLLIEAGQRLRHAVRDGDIVARLGGDEFVVLLNELDESPALAAQQARQVGDKLLEALAAPYVFGDLEFVCSGSIGINLFGEGDSVEQIMQRADVAMYSAKKAGRNTLCFFDVHMQTAITRHAELEQALAVAVREQQFVLFYQPQWNRAGETVGAEALIRWQHPALGLLLPGAFIDVAESSGLIVPMGLWVLDAACAQLRQWAQAPLTADLVLAVNISARQFAQDDFVARVSQVIERHGVAPHRLKLELTESLVHDIDDTRAKMAALRRLGVGFAIDDFGTGYSSLSRLTTLPLSQLKVDQSFVQRMVNSPPDAVVVQTIIAMGHSLGLEVMAEGVETEQQLAMLIACGCTSFQGYLRSRPVPPDDFLRLLA